MSPTRLRPGQVLTITGKNFGARVQDNTVSFGGKPGQVTRASPEQIQVALPSDLATAPGRDTPILVIVTTRGSETVPLTLAVYQAPELRGLAPEVAMPGDEVVVSGGGWASAPKVLFGTTEAQLVETTPRSIKVKVPALDAPPGTSLKVVVASGPDRSEPAQFMIGRLPWLSATEPNAAAPGDVVTLRGRGFDPQASANVVRFGGRRALVVSRSDAELKVVVPMLPGGETPVEIRVPGSDHVGHATMTLARPPDSVAFRFVAELFEDVAGHDHAVLVSGLGPAFVISAAGGRAAAERALQAQQRLNEAAARLGNPAEQDLEVRTGGTEVSIGLAGRKEPLIEIAQEDAAAYNELGGGFRGNAGRQVTRGRLAVFWLALTRDLVGLLVRGERARHIALFTPEGRFLAEVADVSRRGGSAGVSRKALDTLGRETLQGLQVIALRVPATVPESVGGPESAVASVSNAEDPLQLEGAWSGTATEGSVPKSLKVTFGKGMGTLSYERPLQLSYPILQVERSRAGSVQFSVRMGGGTRYYRGTWDGEKLAGSISATPDGKSVIGSFELRR